MNSTWTGLALNPDFGGERLMTNSLGLGSLPLTSIWYQVVQCIELYVHNFSVVSGYKETFNILITT
jgi:hypothetical protein